MIPQTRTAIIAAAAFTGYFLLGYGGIKISGGHGTVAVIWPATAFGICMLLRWSRRARLDVPLLGAIFAGGLLANGLTGASPVHNLGGFGRIEIVNAGPGIPAPERHLVFQPFSRGEQNGRQVPGAGLGLSIAKLLVERQGGRIDFDSVPGRQTRFWIDLPLVA